MTALIPVAAFLARYQGRTLDAYRYDLRAFFQWAADEGLVILSATRPQPSSDFAAGGAGPLVDGKAPTGTAARRCDGASYHDPS